MDWKPVGDVVKAAAPLLGAALGGPVGAVAATAGTLLSSILGTDATPEAVAEAVRADPEISVKLRQIEAQQRATLLAWVTAQQEAENANVKDARARELALAAAGHAAAWAPAVLSLAIIAGFFWMAYSVLLRPGELSQAGIMLLGAMSAAFAAVVNYYLGSSLGSARKTDALLGRQGRE